MFGVFPLNKVSISWHNLSKETHERVKEMGVLPILNKHFSELNPVVFGEEACDPGHSHGPSMRSAVLVHHVLSGKGTFYSAHGTFEVHAGQAFIILPYEEFKYVADLADPWHYVWIAFDGSLSERFSLLPPVVASDHRLFRSMLTVFDKQGMAEEFLAGKLFELYSLLFSEETANPDDYIARIRSFVDANYNGSCDVTEIAAALNLELHYLSRLFKQKTGMTLKGYITDKRMHVAKSLLASGKSVSFTANMVGYRDPFLFSKMFKKHNGVSPKEWQKVNRDENAPTIFAGLV